MFQKMREKIRDQVYPVLRLVPGTMEYQLRIGAWRLAQGHRIFLPSQTVNTFSVDGSQEKAVEKLNELKRHRQPDQRPGVIVAAQGLERIIPKINFEVMEQSDCKITPEGFVKFFKISHAGMVVPCYEDAFPLHLTLEREFNGVKVPTVLIVCNMTYGPWQRFEQELSRFSGVIWVGTSASDENKLSLRHSQIRRHPNLATKIRDHKVERLSSLVSYTLVNAIEKHIERYGDVNPETHPEEYKAWDREVFGGRLQYRTKASQPVPA